MERKIFHKAKLATAIALVSTTTLLTGCLVDGNKSNTNSTTVQEDASRISITDQATPLAQILGLVQDTNGNPVVGARVSIGSTAATTDANGAYAISNVPVTGFTGGTDAESATAIQVSIVPAAGYLSATVSVSPQASTIVQTIDGASGNTEDALLAIVTTDGLAVSAGITVVPALQSTVTGYLRDKESGEKVIGTVVGLELTQVNGVAQQQVQNGGSATSYGVASYQVATDDDGMFTFTNLPVDADFDIAVEGWAGLQLEDGIGGAPAAASFDTTPEVTVQNIGTITAELITSEDVIEPFVASVNGVVVNAATGLLNDDLDGTQGLTINFSEPLQQLVDENSIYLYNETLQERIEVADFDLSEDGHSLTITTSAAIAQGQTFAIYLSDVDFQDIAGNLLEAGPVADFQGKSTPDYDSDYGTLTSSNAVKLTLQTFSDPVTDAGAVVDLAQQFTDGGTSDFELLQSSNSTFADVDTGTVRSDDLTIEQLNAPDAAARLSALAISTYSEPGITTSPTPASVATDVARVQFVINETTQSSNYRLELTDASGSLKNFTVVAPDQTLSANDSNALDVEITLVDDFEGTLNLLVDGAEPNDTLTISSLTSFGTVDESSNVLLLDQIAPTTVKQSSYGQGLKTNATVGVSYGDGGELADLTPAAMGTPIVNVTPRLLTPQANETIALPVASTWNAVQALMQDGVVDPANSINTSDGEIDVNMAGITAGYSAYDAQAFAAWSVGERTMGIAFSEDITLSGTPVVTGTSTGIAQVLAGWTAQNNVLVNDQSLDVNDPNLPDPSADLIHVTVPDVIDFANQDHGRVIDFTGVIVDANGNTPATENNAMVVVRDLMPPMLESARYYGGKIILTYNEDVFVPVGAKFVLDPTSTDIVDNVTITSTAANTAVDGNEVTITPADLDSETVFDRNTFDHDGDDSASTEDRAHGIIITENVEDLLGTSWANWDDTGAGSVPAVAIPGVVIRDDVDDFDYTVQTSSISGNSFTITYRFTHQIDLSDANLGAEAEDNKLTGVEIAAKFNLGALTIEPTSTGTLTLTDDGSVLRLDIDADAPVTGNSFEIDPGLAGLDIVSIGSKWDDNDAAITTLGSTDI